LPDKYKNIRDGCGARNDDNGKPIRESRDIDIPLVARHFYHHAGWAQLLEQEFPGYSACGVVGQIIPWNFPLLMLAWKIAPRACDWKYGCAQAGGVHADDGTGICGNLCGSGIAGGRGEHCDRRWIHRRSAVKHADVDKIAFTDPLRWEERFGERRRNRTRSCPWSLAENLPS